MESVMGEGNPGEALCPFFYESARNFANNHDSLLMIDSIQAGFRCTGELSIVDYPEFENLQPPDMEAFSKALNGGQYPFSVLALSEKAANKFQHGLYGNTMTTNPRALEVASTILDLMTDEVKENICTMGEYLYQEFTKLKNIYPFITDVSGTGLLLATTYR